MTEKDLRSRLANSFRAPEYAYLPQVRNGTGFQSTVRTADALVLSLWPSRGLDLMGFEIKVSRGDWLKEKKNPEKAEEIIQYCDRWWIVTSNELIIREGELPANWGWRYWNGDRWKIVREAPKLKAKTISRDFLCAMLRQATTSMIPEDAIHERIKAATEAARGARDYQFQELKDRVEEFEKASGVNLSGGYRWQAGQVGEAVRAVLASRGSLATTYMKAMRQAAEGVIACCDEAEKRAAEMVNGKAKGRK